MPFLFLACSTLFSIICAEYQSGGKGSKSVPLCVEGSKISGSSSNSDMICLLRLGCHSSDYARLRLREELAQRGHKIELLWDTDALGHAVAVLRNECRPSLAVQPPR